MALFGQRGGTFWPVTFFDRRDSSSTELSKVVRICFFRPPCLLYPHASVLIRKRLFFLWTIRYHQQPLPQFTYPKALLIVVYLGHGIDCGQAPPCRPHGSKLTPTTGRCVRALSRFSFCGSQGFGSVWISSKEAPQNTRLHP